MMLFRCLMAALVMMLSVSVASIAAQAQTPSFEQGLSLFTTDNYPDTEAAISATATSGNPRAAAIIRALAEGRLLAGPDKRLFIRDSGGAITDAASGAPTIVEASSLKMVRLNNRLRRAIDAATGTLTLLDGDVRRRIEAAQSVFRSRDEAALPALDTAIARETDERAKRVLAQARAAIVLAAQNTTENDKLVAIAVLRERGDQDALAVLRQIPSDAPPTIRQAVESASGAIETSLAFWAALQNIWYGLSLGSVLLLAAVGLAITFGVMGVINMAHGEMVMLGAYTTFVVQELIRAHAPWLFDASLFIAIPMAFLVAGGVGVLVERGIIRFLYGRPLETLLATWGLSLVLQQTVRSIFGANNREVGNPSWMSGAIELGGLSITANRLAIVAFALIVFAILLVVLHRTSLGLRVRAVTQNRRMAGSMGIRTNRIDALTFGLGSGIAGIAGVALSQIDNVSPNLGQSYIIDSFMVVVFGGVGNLWGTLVGAFTLGIANKFLEPYAGAVLGKIAILVLIILFIQKRPRGLFALKGRAVEA